MDESLRSILIGLTPVYVILMIAAVLTAARRSAVLSAEDSDRIIHPLLFGIAWQCVHFTEEFATGLYAKLPALMNLSPWSPSFFVGFNVAWIAIFVVSVVGIRRNVAIAYFPVWFLAVALLLNGVLHPLLSLYSRGYFPGLITSPVAGLIGLLLLRRLVSMTRSRD